MWVLLKPLRFGGAKSCKRSRQSVSTLSVFQVHGVDNDGKVVIRRQLKRRYVLAFFEKLQPCLVGIEACASSHHWLRELQALGHTVRLMPPAYVKPYVKRQKNDAADAEAICEAVTRTNMRFVPIKTPEQQSGLMLHRTRHLFIRQPPGFMPGDEVPISLDIASSEFYRDGVYRLAHEGLVLDSDAMSAMLIDWLDRFPLISIWGPLVWDD